MEALRFFVFILATSGLLYAVAAQNCVRKERLCIIRRWTAYPRIEQLRGGDNAFIYLFFFAIIIFRCVIDPHSIPDTWYYADNFKDVGNIPWSTLVIDGGADYGIEDEKGFLLLTKVISGITSNQYIYICILGSVITFGYFILIRGYSQIVWLSCILFLLCSFNQSLFVIRQYLAMTVLFVSLKFILRRDLLRFVVCVLVAFFFHRTAIIFLPVFFLYGIENKRRLLFYSLIAVAVVRFFIVTVIGHVLSLYADLAGYASDEEGANIKMTLFITSLLLTRLLLLRDCYWERGVNRLFTIILLCGAAVSILSFGFGFDRIVIYFSTFLCVIVPQTLVNIKNKVIKYIYAIAFFAVQIYLWSGSLNH